MKFSINRILHNFRDIRCNFLGMYLKFSNIFLGFGVFSLERNAFVFTCKDWSLVARSFQDGSSNQLYQVRSVLRSRSHRDRRALLNRMGASALISRKQFRLQRANTCKKKNSRKEVREI